MRTILHATVLLLCSLGWAASLPGRYPNEVQGFAFSDTSRWKSLVPLESGMKDVRATMGIPDVAKDLAQYAAPYPGDSAARQPVWTYHVDSRWDLVIHFVKSGYPANEQFPSNLGDRLHSIDCIPLKRMRFPAHQPGPGFAKRRVVAAGAKWNEFSDGTGLVYEVFSEPTREGDRAGDLNRIVYGPSDSEVARHLGPPDSIKQGR
jgi:hypothetical protein